jgi:phytoene synthase
MKKIFDDVSKDCSKIITKKYSTSFSLGISLLDKKLHNPIYSIYGFVRLADEIVDSFHDHNKKELLEKYRKDTKQAINEKISLNPVLNSFQNVVNKYNIDWKFIEQFLNSMQHDIYNTKHNESSYKEYIAGSAEAVGLMCLRVFCNNQNDLFNNLEDYAKILGSVFQKVNFIRDINADYNQLQRVYFPNLDINKFNKQEKLKIELDIENEFKSALVGVKKLPAESKKGVFLAYSYYYSLFKKIKKTPASQILHKRIRIPNTLKIITLIKIEIKYRLNLI